MILWKENTITMKVLAALTSIPTNIERSSTVIGSVSFSGNVKEWVFLVDGGCPPGDDSETQVPWLHPFQVCKAAMLMCIKGVKRKVVLRTVHERVLSSKTRA